MARTPRRCRTLSLAWRGCVQFGHADSTCSGQPEEVRAGLERRGPAATATLDAIAERAAERKKVLLELETLRATRNAASDAMAKVDKKSPEFAAKREELRVVGDRVKELDARHKAVENELEDLLLVVPNIPDASTPTGRGEGDNPVVRVWGEKPAFPFAPKDHVALGEWLRIMDFERGVKISGARFTVLRAAGSRLERALLQFMLDVHTTEHGYTEIWPPVLVKDSAMRGTGQLPKFAKDASRLRKINEYRETEGYDSLSRRRQKFRSPTCMPTISMRAYCRSRIRRTPR